MDCPQDNRQNRVIYLVLIVITFALFSRVLNSDFINFDDGTYITENAMVQNGLTSASVVWAFTSGYATNWHPLTWISHMLDCQLYSLNPQGHHLTGLLFHILNVLLLFLVLRQMTGAVWRSAVVAALFAWHPLHVESVAWVSERKDVLSTFFWLLTMLAYARYAEESKARELESKVQSPKSKVFYGLALVCFALGLMAKPMLVTLPFLLLLLDFWPLGRLYDLRFTIDESKDLQSDPQTKATTAPMASPTSRKSKIAYRKLLLEKVPFFLLAIASSVVTFLVQKTGGAVASLEALSFRQRIANALVSYIRYLGKMVWPHDLAVFYPIHHGWAAWQWVGAGLLIVAISLLAIAMLRRRPYFSVGWFWYLGTLVPVIGLVQVGGQSMADRYTYMPLVGIFIIFSWGVADLLGRGQLRRLNLAWAVIVPVLVACLVVTWNQAGYWKDSITLFRHAIAVTTDNTLAHVDLGQALDKAGQVEEAKAEFFTALKLEPNSASTLTGLGTLYVHEKDLTNALSYFNSALSKQPFFGDAHYNLANLLAAEGRRLAGEGNLVAAESKFAEAAGHYAQSLNYNPNAPDAENNFGAVLVALGKPGEAVDHFKATLRLKPNFPEAQAQLGGAYLMLGHSGLAKIHYAEAIRINPNFAHAHLKLGLIEAAEGHLEPAISQFLETIKLEPTNAVAYYNLGAAYQAGNQLDKAFEGFSEAVRLKPGDAETQGRLAGVLARQGKLDESIKYYREAVRLKPEDALLRGHMAAVLMVQGKFEPAMESYREAIRLKPQWPDPMRDLAWILATNPKPEVRNGAEALRLAQRACELAGHPDARFLSALEVAYAEVGRFDDAIKTARQIQQLPASPAQKYFATAATNHMELYRAGKPVHE